MTVDRRRKDRRNSATELDRSVHVTDDAASRFPGSDRLCFMDEGYGPKATSPPQMEPSMSTFPNLFSPGRLGGHESRNRLVLTPMVRNSADDAPLADCSLLLERLDHLRVEVMTVGDAVEPHKVAEAILEGARAAMAV